MPRLEHVGIAVDAPEAVAACYREVLGVLPYKTETVADQGVRTHFISAGSAKLELLEAVADDSPVAAFLKKRGEGLHHLAFEVDDIDEAFARLQNAGFTPLSEAPIRGADDKRIFFLHPKDTHGVLIECCQSTPPTLTPQEIPFREGTLAAYERGRSEAPTVLLLHGAGGCTRMDTAPLMRRLESDFHVLAVDFSGHGASDMPDASFSADLFADNARSVLDFFDVERADIFGFSMGGTMALRFAHQHPKRVRRLAVHGANIDWTPKRAKAMQSRFNANRVANEYPHYAEQLDRLHADWRTLFRRLRAFIASLPDRAGALTDMAVQVHHSTLVSAVDRDDLFPLEAPLHLYRQLPNSRLALIPGEQHALPAVDLNVLMALLRTHFAWS